MINERTILTEKHRRRVLFSFSRIVLLLVSSLALLGCEESFDLGKKKLTGPFLVRDGITYDQESNQPITGIALKYFEGGQLKYKAYFKGGKKEGLEEYYFENGQLNQRSNYRGGKKEGLYEVFNRFGDLSLKGNFKHGERNGLWTGYKDHKGKPTAPVCYVNDLILAISDCLAE